MSRINRPLRLWHALLATVAVFAIGVAGTAIAVGGKNASSAVSAKAKRLGRSHGYVYLSKTGDQVPSGETDYQQIKCPRHSVVTGGGVYISGSSLDAHVNTTFPLDSGDRGATPEDGWAGHIGNDTGTPKEETVYAICKKF